MACDGIGFYEGYAELKRMYAKPDARGAGVAGARLEAEAVDAGLAAVRIEIGNRQDAAMRFYERAGYRQCGAFGPYAEMPPNAIAAGVFMTLALREALKLLTARRKSRRPCDRRLCFLPDDAC